MAVLDGLSRALEVSVADLLADRGHPPTAPLDAGLVPVLNDPYASSLVPPGKTATVPAQPLDNIFIPNVLARSSFALYLVDESMEPEFGKGNLVVFSLSRKPKDGEACLVDTGRGQILFRTALSLPGRQWRLQPNNPKFAPIVIKSGKALRMWPAIGYWRILDRRGGAG